MLGVGEGFGGFSSGLDFNTGSLEWLSHLAWDVGDCHELSKPHAHCQTGICRAVPFPDRATSQDKP